MSKILWHVEIHEDDWDYDNFESAVVWAESAEEAEAIIRDEWRNEPDPASTYQHYRDGTKWIEEPGWRLIVKPAPAEGVALIHWHAG